MNELLWFAMLLVNFAFIIFAYKFWGKAGLYIWIPISTILANIQVLKSVVIFGMPLTLGNIVYASAFLVTDILSENYGKKEAKRAIHIGFFSVIAMTILMNLAIYFVPSAEDFGNGSISTIFGFMPRIMLGSLAAYYVSQIHDINAFEFWKKRFPADKHLWIRNNLSTMVSQFLDTVVFTFIVFTGEFEFKYMIQLIFTTYIMKWIVAALDTPFLYVAKNLFKNKKIKEEILYE